jgi:undecaprenyl diphosphate synthase
MHNLHVAIIMDGNGRWAQRRGLARTAGHVAGAAAVRAVVESAASRGVRALSLYAFSADNWRRPGAEVAGLMRLLQRYLLTQTSRCLEQRVRLSVIGRRDRLGARLVRAIEHAERATAGCTGLHLRLAVDYSAQHSILQAARLAGEDTGPADFQRLLDQVDHAGDGAGAVDLLIRTGSEQRLSDFLLWECAYAELYFTERMWPDFGPADLQAALESYASRQRRFGALAATAR